MLQIICLMNIVYFYFNIIFTHEKDTPDQRICFIICF
jgi:hypothetical protein